MLGTLRRRAAHNGGAKLLGGSGQRPTHSRASRRASHLALTARQPGQLQRLVMRPSSLGRRPMRNGPSPSDSPCGSLPLAAA
jgi:hypothetical protein